MKVCPVLTLSTEFCHCVDIKESHPVGPVKFKEVPNASLLGFVDERSTVASTVDNIIEKDVGEVFVVVTFCGFTTTDKGLLDESHP
jgi:hypothetical protein